MRRFWEKKTWGKLWGKSTMLEKVTHFLTKHCELVNYMLTGID